jgi:hypothetical protein
MDANEIRWLSNRVGSNAWGALWWVRRSKHPSRSIANAFGIFIGVFGGIVLSALLAVALLWETFLPEVSEVPRAIGCQRRALLDAPAVLLQAHPEGSG